jgi:Asp-tRNA(Asn)/Glu-tRNA(Gln) amidotransferase A subunit family amidase
VQPARLIRLYTRGWGEIDASTGRAFEEVITAVTAAGVEIVTKDNDQRVAEFEDAIERDVDSALDIVAYEMKWPFRGLYRALRRQDRQAHTWAHRARSEDDAGGLHLGAREAQFNSQPLPVARRRSRCTSVSHARIFRTGDQGIRIQRIANFHRPGIVARLPRLLASLDAIRGLPFGLQLIGIDHRDGNLCSTANWITQTLAADQADS